MTWGALRNHARLLILLATFGVLSAGQAQTLLKERWTLFVRVSDSTPAIGEDGTIYLGSFFERFWAVNTNGEPRWTFNTGSEIKSSPAIGRDGTIYFGCRNRRLYALSPKGKKKWEFATGGWVDSSPALAEDGTIYFGSWDHHFYALNPDGSLKWKFKTGSQIDSSPAVGAAGTIYFGSHDKRFYALTPAGERQWEFATDGAIVSSPALTGDGVIYFTSLDGFLYAHNEDGTLKWRLKTGGSTSSSPTIAADGIIYLGVNDYLWAVTPEGKRKWDWWGRTFAESSPTMIEGNLLFVAPPFRTACMSDTHKNVLWMYPGGRGHGSPVVGRDGTPYIVGGNECLTALETNHALARAPWPKFRGNYRNTGNVKDVVR